MTCSTCEKRVEDAAGSVPGVLSAKADQSRGRLTLAYDTLVTSADDLTKNVEDAVTAAGYTVLGAASRAEKPQTTGVLIVAAGMIALFLLINSQGWFSFLPTIDSSVGLGMVFVAGLLTSMHCVAMCGGIALSQQNKDIGAGGSPVSRFRTSLRGLPYHLGRIASYTVLGGVVGALGSVVSFSPLTKGILAGVAGLFMVGLGLKMLGLLPKLTWLRLPKLPRIIPHHLTMKFRSRGPFFIGLLNGFMPCGPLQTMQLYALGTGSVALGALSMFLFSVGTVPLMFAFGALSSFFSAKWQHRLVRASAILVVFFGVVMSGRALDLSGASGQLKTLADQVTGADKAPVNQASLGGRKDLAEIRNGIQYVSFDLEPGTYSPITVQKGVPVEWTINAVEDNLNGCNEEITIPQLGLTKKLRVGANLIQFTPTSTGTISYTCWMGMIGSSIRVVDNLGSAPPQELAQALPPLGGTPGTGAGGCCSPGTAPAFADGRIPTDVIQKAQFKTELGRAFQEVTVTVDDQGYSPAVLVVQKGIPTRFTFVGKKLNGCNSYVDFPAYGAGLDLSKGQLQTPQIPVGQDFVFQCGMAMLHGYVRVVPDLATADLAEVKATVAAWKPAAGSGGCCGG